MGSCSSARTISQLAHPHRLVPTRSALDARNSRARDGENASSLCVRSQTRCMRTVEFQTNSASRRSAALVSRAARRSPIASASSTLGFWSPFSQRETCGCDTPRISAACDCLIRLSTRQFLSPAPRADLLFRGMLELLFMAHEYLIPVRDSTASGTCDPPYSPEANTQP